MKSFFRKLFNIYPGEEKVALLFAGLGFLWAFGVTSGQKFADALFLLHVGADSLPLAYTLAACAMMIMTAFFLKAFHYVPIQRIFATVLLGGVVFYISAYFGLLSMGPQTSPWFWFLLKIFGSVFFANVVTCFWTFVDHYFHLQDAKRLYSLFTSAIFLGVAATGIIMRSGWIDIRDVLLLITCLLLFSVYWITRILPHATPLHDDSLLEEDEAAKKGSFRYLFKSILRSKFILLLMVGNFLTYVLLVITEYSYLSAFDAHFDQGIRVVTGQEEKAQLTIFLGQLITGVSVFNLIVGLFFYSRLVRRYGITNLVLYTPLVLVFTFSGWLANNALFFPVVGFFVVEGMLYTIDDNNFSLLLNAVPARLKYKVRLIIESFFEPTGMLISSLLITFTPINSKILGLVLSSCALFAAMMVRKQYLKAILINLSENAIHFHRSAKNWLNRLSKKEQKILEQRLEAIMQKSDDASQLFASEAFINLGDKGIFHRLLDQTDSLSTNSKMTLIEAASKSKFNSDPHLLDRLHTWLSETSDNQLKGAIHFYLARLGLLHPDKIVSDLDSSDLLFRGAAILALKKSWAHLPPTSAASNRALAAQYLQILLDSSDEDEVSMGVKILGIDALPQDIDILIPFLKKPSLKIARSAAASIAQIADKHSVRYAPTLLLQLETVTDTEIRQSCLRALGKMNDSSLVKEIISKSIHLRPSERRFLEKMIAKMGLRTVPILMAIVKDSTMHDRSRVLAGRILGELAQSQLQANMHNIVSVEINRAYFYFYHAHTIQSKYPEIDLTVLKDALLSRYRSILDFIIQLLGVVGESEDCDLLSRSLRSTNPKVRSHVLETLEKSSDIKIFRALYPLIADLPHAEKMAAYEKSGQEILNLQELLDRMSSSPIQGDKIIAAAFKYRLDMPNWRESLRKQMATHEEIFHHFAYELLET